VTNETVVTEEQQDSSTTSGKPRGWFGRRVEELDSTYQELIAEIQELKELVRNTPHVLELLNHPIVDNFEQWEKRIRRIEQTQLASIRAQDDLNSRLTRAERAAKTLEDMASRRRRE
jgi:predicted glycoside hydrolase/deacetylase ChbG (UPF0249 family)